jgi:hypothetical protein
LRGPAVAAFGSWLAFRDARRVPLRVRSAHQADCGSLAFSAARLDLRLAALAVRLAYAVLSVGVSGSGGPGDAPLVTLASPWKTRPSHCRAEALWWRPVPLPREQPWADARSDVMDDQFFQHCRLAWTEILAWRRCVVWCHEHLRSMSLRTHLVSSALAGSAFRARPQLLPLRAITWGSMQARVAHPGQLDSSLPSAPSAWCGHPKVVTPLRPATGACLLRSSWSLAGLLSWGSSQRLPLHRHPTCASSPGLLPTPSRGVPSGLGMQPFRLSPSVLPRLRCEPSAPACQSGTPSALAVSHDFGGLLHTRSAGLLHPAADHGVRLVAGSWLGPASTPPVVSCLPEGLHVVPSGARHPLHRSEDRSALRRRPTLRRAEARCAVSRGTGLPSIAGVTGG